MNLGNTKLWVTTPHGLIYIDRLPQHALSPSYVPLVALVCTKYYLLLPMLAAEDGLLGIRAGCENVNA